VAAFMSLLVPRILCQQYTIYLVHWPAEERNILPLLCQCDANYVAQGAYDFIESRYCVVNKLKKSTIEILYAMVEVFNYCENNKWKQAQT
jgi:hypothetical protein